MGYIKISVPKFTMGDLIITKDEYNLYYDEQQIGSEIIGAITITKNGKFEEKLMTSGEKNEYDLEQILDDFIENKIIRKA